MSEELTRRVREYYAARDKIDKVLEGHSVEIQRNLTTVVNHRALVFQRLIGRWADHCEALGYPFAAVVNVNLLNEQLAAAITEYIRYAFYYRFANNLARNIVYRKIFSFELYYFHRRGVLARNQEFQAASLVDMTTDERLFHLSPLTHFFGYRLLKEFRLAKMDLPDALPVLELFKRVQGVVTTKLLDFVTRADQTLSNDTFREYLEQPGNEEINVIFKIVETLPPKEPTLFSP